MFPIARSRTVRSVIAMAALIALATLAAAGCSSDADRTAAVASTMPTETTAQHLAAATRRLVAPDRSNFHTEIGTVGLPCQGTGNVPVVLVAGTDDPITRWDRLVEDAGQEVLFCRFDPSSATRWRATPKARADALSSALEQSGLPAPYVLVGHSLGGLTVRRFGVDHPDQLGGALLLDPTTPVALQYPEVRDRPLRTIFRQKQDLARHRHTQSPQRLSDSFRALAQVAIGVALAVADRLTVGI